MLFKLSLFLTAALLVNQGQCVTNQQGKKVETNLRQKIFRFLAGEGGLSANEMYHYNLATCDSKTNCQMFGHPSFEDTPMYKNANYKMFFANENGTLFTFDPRHIVESLDVFT